MNKILKKHGKKILVNSVVCSLVVAVITYVIVGPYNSEFVKILQGVANKSNSQIELSIIMFFIALILCLIVELAKIVMKEK